MRHVRRLEKVGTFSRGKACLSGVLSVRVEWDLRQTGVVWLMNDVAGGGANKEGSGSDFAHGMVLDVS